MAKSPPRLHAIVHVDAEDYTEYRKRVEFLYDFLEKNGATVDKQNRNPSRLSRLPGATRNGNRQYLVATNIGRKSWVDWMDFVEGVSDELPDLVMLSDIEKNPPKEKRAVGCQYNTEAKKLSEFSRFSLTFEIPAGVLTKELVQAWIAKKPTDSDRNQHARYSLVCQLAKYMERMGHSAYVPGRDEIGKLHKTFIPYIFTHDEIRAFFEAAGSMTCPPKSGAPRRRLIMPVLFRMLYCCGLRVSEATMLLGEDVNLGTGILTIRESKFGKARYVPMSDELITVCTDYAKARLVGKPDADWFFAAPDGGHYDTRSIYSVFRELLWKAGISHGGRGKGPRAHDFRHTFSVHCLQKWVAQGADPTAMLPRLTAYLGHNDFSATEQYLRLTAEVYPEISNLMEEKYGYIIPVCEGVGE